MSLKHECSKTFSVIIKGKKTKPTWESNLVLKLCRWEERGCREVLLRVFCREMLKQRAVLKQCGLSSLWAGSTPWNTWTWPPDLSKNYLRESQEQHILSCQPKLLLLLLAPPLSAEAVWCAMHSAFSKGVDEPFPTYSMLLSKPSVSPQLPRPLLHHRQSVCAPVPRLWATSWVSCTSQAVPRSCTCSQRDQHIQRPERS